MTREEVNKEISLLQEKDRNNGGLDTEDIVKFASLLLLWMEFEENKNAPSPQLDNIDKMMAEHFARELFDK